MDYRFACRTFMALKFLSRLELEPVQDYPGVVVLADFPKACLDRHAYLHLPDRAVEQVGRERVHPCHAGSSFLLERLKNRFAELLGSLLLSLVALHQLQIRLHRGCC